MKKTKRTYLQKTAWGFILSAALLMAAVICLWKSPVLWEFFLQETLPYYQKTDIPYITPEPAPEHVDEESLLALQIVFFTT